MTKRTGKRAAMAGAAGFAVGAAYSTARTSYRYGRETYGMLHRNADAWSKRERIAKAVKSGIAGPYATTASRNAVLRRAGRVGLLAGGAAALVSVGRSIVTGPNGGRYYRTASGSKRYVKGGLR